MASANADLPAQSPSANPWADAEPEILKSQGVVPTLEFDPQPALSATASINPFDTTGSVLPPASKPLPDSKLLEEFDPLADKVEVNAQEAWSSSQGHPPPLQSDPPPQPPVPQKERPQLANIKAHRRAASTAFDTPTSAAATVTSFGTLANLARSLTRPRSTTSSPVVAPKLPLPDDKVAPPPTPSKNDQPLTAPTQANEGTAKEPPAFDFQVFLDQMKTKSAEPVSKYLRSFLTNFSKKNFTVNDQIKLIHDFLGFIVVKMRECEVWKHMDENDFDNASEGMEKLVMNRLHDFTFTPRIDTAIHPITTDDLEKDHILRQRMKLFSWVSEKHLDVPTGDGSQGFLDFAQQELLKINHYKAPRDKLICILNSCKVIFGLIRHLHHDEGADSFIPILIYVVLKANPEHLMSNVEYINRFRSPKKLQSEAGYYLSSLMGAVSFIETMDHTSLSNITQEEFEQHVEDAITALPPSPSPAIPPTSPRLGNPNLMSFSQSQALSSTHAGEESAKPLQLPSTTTVAEDAKRFLQRTGDLATETISKPLNAIGRIFNDALDGLDEREREKESLRAVEREQNRESGSFMPSAEWLFGSGTGSRSSTPSGSRIAEFGQVGGGEGRPGSRLARTPMGGGAPVTPGGIQQAPYRPRMRPSSASSNQGQRTPDATPTHSSSTGNHAYQIPPLSFTLPSPQGTSVHLPSPARQYDNLPPSSSLPNMTFDPRLHPQQQQHVHQPRPQRLSELQQAGMESRDGSPLDLTALSNEIDRAHSAATQASRATLLQIFPTCDPDIVDMVLEATNNDLGLSIDRLLEITTT